MNKKTRILLPLSIIIISILSYFIYESFTYVSTDDAQVSAHVTMLSSRINGTIEKVWVQENQKVKAGQILSQIDTSEYLNALEGAKAQVASLEARLQEAEINFKRSGQLVKTQAISLEKFDAAKASYRELVGRLQAAQSQLNQANLNVTYTRIIAPADGIIARKSVEPGQFVPVGQALFGFVANTERWVTANLKETELGSIQLRNPVTITIDALQNKTIKGEVESISPSTGAIFSLLPPDNATGNFTKVVQRVPIRIKLLNLQADDSDRLQAGLSAVVSIRVR